MKSFSGGAVLKNPPANARDTRHGFDPWVRKIPGAGNGNPLQYSCLENPIDREAGWTTVHRVAESQTEHLSAHTHTSIEEGTVVICPSFVLRIGQLDRLKRKRT